jgi:hypothetical protein
VRVDLDGFVLDGFVCDGSMIFDEFCDDFSVSSICDFSACRATVPARHGPTPIVSCPCSRLSTAALSSTARRAAVPHRVGPHRAGPGRARASAGPGSPFGQL